MRGLLINFRNFAAPAACVGEPGRFYGTSIGSTKVTAAATIILPLLAAPAIIPTTEKISLFSHTYPLRSVVLELSESDHILDRSKSEVECL
jgi:hypothetical protein